VEYEKADDMDRELDASAVDIIDQLLDAEREMQIQSHEFTAYDYIARSGKPIAYDKAAKRLERLYQAGRLSRRKVYVNSRRCWAYSKVE